MRRYSKRSRYQNRALKTRSKAEPIALLTLLDKLKMPLLGYRMRRRVTGFGKVDGSVGRSRTSERARAVMNSPANEGEIDYA
jgi:hypothetical protein